MMRFISPLAASIVRARDAVSNPRPEKAKPPMMQSRASVSGERIAAAGGALQGVVDLAARRAGVGPRRIELVDELRAAADEERDPAVAQHVLRPHVRDDARQQRR